MVAMWIICHSYILYHYIHFLPSKANQINLLTGVYVSPLPALLSSALIEILRMQPLHIQFHSLIIVACVNQWPGKSASKMTGSLLSFQLRSSYITLASSRDGQGLSTPVSNAACRCVKVSTSGQLNSRIVGSSENLCSMVDSNAEKQPTQGVALTLTEQ